MDDITEELSFDELVDKFSAAEPKFVEPVEDPEDEEPEEQEEVEDTSEDDANEDDEEGGDEGSDPDSEDQGEEDAEAEIEVEGTKVPVSELTRLYKEREQIAETAKAAREAQRLVEAQGLHLAKLYEDRLIKAQQAVQKYANVDLFQAYRELDADEFETLKAAKEAAEAEYATVTAEAQGFMQSVAQTKQAYLREQAKQSLGIIRQAIPDWNDQVYNQVRTYAVSQGMDVGTVNDIVDAPAIIMMHKAMLYDAAKTNSEKVVKKVVKAPKKVVKKAEDRTDSESAKSKRLMAAARASGDIDDVTAAFMAARR